jgi:hypothetical protein
MKPMSKEEGDMFNFFEAGTPDDYITFQAGKDLPEHEDSVPRDFAVCVDDEAVRRRKESKEMIWWRALGGRAELVKGGT